MAITHTNGSINGHQGDSQNRPLRIAIIGGGIGGLTCAVALKKANLKTKNIQLDIYESQSEINEIGAGINVWPRTWGLLKDLGLEEDLIRRYGAKPELDKPKIMYEFRKSDQKEGTSLFELKMNGSTSNLHRRDIQQALLQQLQAKSDSDSSPFYNIHVSHRLTKFTETEKDTVELEFSNGTKAECDLLIGADGIRSVVRKSLRNKGKSAGIEDGHWSPKDMIYSGSIVFRGLVPRERLEKMNPNHSTLSGPVMYLGKYRHIVTYQISKGQYVNIVAFHSKFDDFGKPLNGPEVRDATVEEILKVYEGWETEVQELMQCIENPSWRVITEMLPLDSYIGRRTLLLGDAAHPMTPYLGAGAGQAMEDAYILGGIIGATSCRLSDIPRILKTYDSCRRPFANYIVSTSRKQITYYQLAAPEFEDIPEPTPELTEQVKLSGEQSSTLAKAISTHWSWAVWPVDRDYQQAVGMITENWGNQIEKKF
ncbi:FAD/NAD(P)-binding domain-containing protein [Marasmius fiardii PR-910]|nr:FAD/NAD(P)-binding domain-containing protein [Marasmius fiardii PR-910]